MKLWKVQKTRQSGRRKPEDNDKDVAFCKKNGLPWDQNFKVIDGKFCLKV